MPLATPQRAAAGQTLQYRCALVGQLPLPPPHPPPGTCQFSGQISLSQLPSGASEKN